MSDKMFTPKKHVRFDKMGGVTDPCFHEGLKVLIDELGYSGTTLLEEGIKQVLARHGLLNHTKTVARIETTVSEGTA